MKTQATHKQEHQEDKNKNTKSQLIPGPKITRATQTSTTGINYQAQQKTIKIDTHQIKAPWKSVGLATSKDEAKRKNKQTQTEDTP